MPTCMHMFVNVHVIHTFVARHLKAGCNEMLVLEGNRWCSVLPGRKIYIFSLVWFRKGK